MTFDGKFWLRMGIGLAAAAGGYVIWASRHKMFVNDVTTGESSAYPSLRSRVYYADVPQAAAAAEQALSRLPRWKLVQHDSENGVLEAEVRTRVGPFTDDVTVYFFPLGRGQTRVTVRSRSRLGRGDLGQNAHHIRELQAAMDARLNTDAAF
jgi:uncharacterized protein (DUF1499 family)